MANEQSKSFIIHDTLMSIGGITSSRLRRGQPTNP